MLFGRYYSMSEIIFTILMFLVTVILFCVKYILPLLVAVFGIFLVRKKKMNIGYILIIASVLVELISIIMQINSFK